jgi:hypothetical protein
LRDFAEFLEGALAVGAVALRQQLDLVFDVGVGGNTGGGRGHTGRQAVLGRDGGHRGGALLHIVQNVLDGGADGRELLVDAIGAFLHCGDGRQCFAPIVVALYRVHGAARSPHKCVLKLSVFAKAACVAQEWILDGRKLHWKDK